MRYLCFLLLTLGSYRLRLAKRGDIMECRVGCGACCIAISISSPIPGMPNGKPAGIRCLHLTGDNRCRLYGKPERPPVCMGLAPSKEMCGETYEEAYSNLDFLEKATKPN